MDNEEFDRRMKFFLEQQARFYAELEKQKQLQEAQHAITNQQIRELVGSLSTLRDAVFALTYHIERHDQQIAANEKAIAALAERGRETDARLDRLALIVEHHISGHQH
jgi:hypothetical protein